MLLFMIVLLDVANCLMVFSSIMFGFGLGKVLKDVYVNGEDECGMVSAVALDVEGAPLEEHYKTNLLHSLRKFCSSFGSN